MFNLKNIGKAILFLYAIALRTNELQICNLRDLQQQATLEQEDPTVTDLTIAIYETTLEDAANITTWISQSFKRFPNVTKLDLDITLVPARTEFNKTMDYQEFQNTTCFDLLGLKALTKLTTLKILSKKIRFIDLSGLQELKTLEFYFLEALQPLDVSLLQNLTNLIIFNVPFESIINLGRLNNLTSLDIYNDDTNTHLDPTQLQSLQNLETLQLDSLLLTENTLTLSSLQALKEINLKRCPKLKTLDLNFTTPQLSLKNINLLELPALEELFINPEHELHVLRLDNLPRLASIDLAYVFLMLEGRVFTLSRSNPELQIAYAYIDTTNCPHMLFLITNLMHSLQTLQNAAIAAAGKILRPNQCNLNFRHRS